MTGRDRRQSSDRRHLHTSTANTLRLNLYAIIEPDGDGDGYGDETQDLCLDDASAGNTACSGSLVGVDLTDRANGGVGSGPSGSLFVTTAVNTGNATSPVDGVIVRWRFKGSGGAGPHRLRVVKLQGGFDILTVRSSEPLNNPGNRRTVGAIRRAVRIPIARVKPLGFRPRRAHPMLILTLPGLRGAPIQDAPPADGVPATADSAFGVNAPMISADVEPDADGDGFGDITQDQCPTGAGAATAVCPPTLSRGEVLQHQVPRKHQGRRDRGGQARNDAFVHPGRRAREREDHGATRREGPQARRQLPQAEPPKQASQGLQPLREGPRVQPRRRRRRQLGRLLRPLQERQYATASSRPAAIASR